MRPQRIVWIPDRVAGCAPCRGEALLLEAATDPVTRCRSSRPDRFRRGLDVDRGQRRQPRGLLRARSRPGPEDGVGGLRDFVARLARTPSAGPLVEAGLIRAADASDRGGRGVLPAGPQRAAPGDWQAGGPTHRRSATRRGARHGVRRRAGLAAIDASMRRYSSTGVLGALVSAATARLRDDVSPGEDVPPIDGPDAASRGARRGCRGCGDPDPA